MSNSVEMVVLKRNPDGTVFLDDSTPRLRARLIHFQCDTSCEFCLTDNGVHACQHPRDGQNQWLEPQEGVPCPNVTA